MPILKERGQVFTLDAMAALLLSLILVSLALDYVHMVSWPSLPPFYQKVSSTAVVQPVKWGWVATGVYRGELPHLEVKEIQVTNWQKSGNKWTADVYISNQIPSDKKIVMAFLVLMVGDNHVVDAYDPNDKDLGVYVDVNGSKTRVFPTVPIDWGGNIGWRQDLDYTYNGRIWEKTLVDLTVDGWGNPLLVNRTSNDDIKVHIGVRIRDSWGKPYPDKTKVVLVLAPKQFDVAVQTWLPDGPQIGPNPYNDVNGKTGVPVKGPLAKSLNDEKNNKYPVTNFADWYGNDVDLSAGNNISINDLITRVGKLKPRPPREWLRRLWWLLYRYPYNTPGTGPYREYYDKNDNTVKPVKDPKDPNGDGADGIVLTRHGDTIDDKYHLFAAYVMMPRTFTSICPMDAPILALTTRQGSPPEFVVYANVRTPQDIAKLNLTSQSPTGLDSSLGSGNFIQGLPPSTPKWNKTNDLSWYGTKVEYYPYESDWYRRSIGVFADRLFGASGYGHLVIIDPKAPWPSTGTIIGGSSSVEDVLRTHSTLYAYLRLPNRSHGVHYYLHYPPIWWFKLPGGFAVQGGPQPRIVAIWIKAPKWLYQWAPWTDSVSLPSSVGFANTRFKNCPGGTEYSGRYDHLTMTINIQRPSDMPESVKNWSVQDVYMFGNLDEDPDNFWIYIDDRQVWPDEWVPPSIEDLKSLSGGKIATPGEHTIDIWEYEQTSPEGVEIGPFNVLVLYKGTVYFYLSSLQKTKEDAVNAIRQQISSLGINPDDPRVRITVAPARGYGKPHEFRLVVWQETSRYTPEYLRKLSEEILSSLQASGVLSYIAMEWEYSRSAGIAAAASADSVIKSVLGPGVHYELQIWDDKNQQWVTLDSG